MSALLRGLWHRGPISLVILIVALVASAAASVGPSYYASARTSIVRDGFATGSVLERGFEVSNQGGVTHALAPVRTFVDHTVEQQLPDPAARRRLFRAPVQAIEATAAFAHTSAPLAWRSGVCAHLHMAAGRCDLGAGKVVVSTSAASRAGWRVGQRLHPVGWPAFTIAGVYAIPHYRRPYWFGRGHDYFPAEDDTAAPGGGSGDSALDALFARRSTLDDAKGFPQGTVVVDQLLRPESLRASDVAALERLMPALEAGTPTMTLAVQTSIPTVLDQVRTSGRTLAVPIFLITVELLVLVWLLMFFVVGDAIAARGPDIALMKLRGRRGPRLLLFALGEPLVLLASALPLGVLLGAASCAGLNHALLRPGTPLHVPWLAWAAAAAATLGGLAAVLLAGRSTLRRPVVAQWEHASRDAGSRNWLADAVLVTAATAGVVELVVSGQVTSVHSGPLGLLVPGLVGLAVAVVASRVLPIAARALFRLTRRRGGLGAFLAVRQVARRRTGARTTIILGTAFALATFALGSWLVGNANRQLVAGVRVGAPTVLTVSAPSHADVAAVVDRLDPSGAHAAVVDNYLQVTTGFGQLLAVDPQRFAHVATWSSDFAGRPLRELMHEVSPRAAAPIRLRGDRLRVRLALPSPSATRASP